MLSPSDFNNAVPQFTNGTYASNPINPQYIEEPGATDYNRGVEPLQTLPAQWWNWLCNKFTSRFNKLNIYVKNIFNELAQLLSLVSETPSGTEDTPTIGQLKDMFENKYPDFLKTAPALTGTFVPQTTKVNGHALSADVTVTKSDVGLGSVANTGDSATPTSGGTTKFTTGGAYTELAKKVDTTRKVNGHALSADVTVTKSDVGLGSVVNTGDSATPVSGGTTKFTTGGAYTELAKKAPNDHSSTATTYGVATTSKYGHLKVGDSFNLYILNGGSPVYSVTSLPAVFANTSYSSYLNVDIKNDTSETITVVCIKIFRNQSYGVEPAIVALTPGLTNQFSIDDNGVMVLFTSKVSTFTGVKS